LDFKIGDAVKLKEGFSPKMVVSCVGTQFFPENIVCKWYDEGIKGYKSETFHKDMLKHYEKKKH